MRTASVETGRGFITFYASMVDAASGGGSAQPGAIPYTYTRVGAGQYTIRFDSGLMPIYVMLTNITVAPAVARITATGAGSFSVAIENMAGALANGSVTFLVVARDARVGR